MKAFNKILPIAIVAVLLAALAAVLILTDKSVREPAVNPVYETHYLTADEASEYQALRDKYDYLAPEYGLLNYERSLKDELEKKEKLSEDEKTILSTLPVTIERAEKSLENEPSLEELKAQMDALGTVEPVSGTDYSMELEVEVKG